MVVEFGTIIAQKRAEKGWTQTDLSEKLFVTRQTVSRWERGYSYPTMDTLVKLSQLLDFSLDYALLGDEEMVDKVSKEQRKAKKNRIIVRCLGVFLTLCVVWWIVDHFQLNTRLAPANVVTDVEVNGSKLIVSVEDSLFWSSRSVMVEEVGKKDLQVEVYQTFRFTNIFRDNNITVFAMELPLKEQKDIGKIRIAKSKRSYSVKNQMNRQLD
ncbi:helix-turn-helix transcriptional regulator [Enterococcus hulanensis]|uniref:helix-turn-helix domain-containing protein n=1 Tax=Enterococcus hulanensis TaxID=2559929 RepID=UPI0028920162|nr:helix-turn-helix transcriptional regulator [Enterococcus hulanensis]MDT2661750.1 helix-turn-helix transcriptional regulator [Enterococcus hulanensis]